MTSMFNIVESEEISISAMFQSCAFLQMAENDGLPSQICLQCYSFVHQAYNFKLQCQKSEGIIRSYLHNDNKQHVKLIKLETVLDNCTAEYVTEDLNDDYSHLEAVTEVEELDEELKEDHNEYDVKVKFVCRDCNEDYKSSEELDTHRIIYHGDNSDKSCPKCAKKFKDRDILNVHMTHCEIHECAICKKKFKTSGYLQNHMKKHNPDFSPEEKRFKCTECDKAYTSPANLTIHQYSHSGIKPYKCQFCDRGFTKTVALNSHLAIHTGKRPYLCSECGRGFTSTSILNQHKKIHSGDLRSHERTHTGERPYECTVCKKRFIQSSGLSSHMATHSGIKSHVCHICNRAFSQASSLARHVKAHI
ncbi:Parkin Interacting Substrate [Carabus blaptoides fortunei]